MQLYIPKQTIAHAERPPVTLTSEQMAKYILITHQYVFETLLKLGFSDIKEHNPEFFIATIPPNTCVRQDSQGQRVLNRTTNICLVTVSVCTHNTSRNWIRFEKQYKLPPSRTK